MLMRDVVIMCLSLSLVVFYYVPGLFLKPNVRKMTLIDHECLLFTTRSQLVSV